MPALDLDLEDAPTVVDVPVYGHALEVDLRTFWDGQCLVGQLVREDQIQPGLRAAPLLVIEPATVDAHTEIHDGLASGKHPQGRVSARVSSAPNLAEVAHGVFGGERVARPTKVGSI